MKEANKKNKKKILLYYLILAACLLVIAAVTVTVIFTVDRNKSNLTIDTGITKPEDNKPGEGDNKPGEGDNKPGEGDNNPGEDDKPTVSTNQMLLPVNTATVSTGYELAWNSTLRLFQVHQGMDFEGEAGDNVFAALDGTVSAVVKDSLIGENYVTITHSDGLKTTYKYLEVNENLKVGDKVKRGDVIGTIAKATGMELKQGDHLHFEINLNGRTTNPDTYLDIREK